MPCSNEGTGEPNGNSESNQTGEKNGKTRRSVIAGASGAALAAMAGCLGEDGNGDGNEEVHFLNRYSNDAWQEQWDEWIPQFEEETGVEMNNEYTGLGENAIERLYTLGQAGDLPDLYVGDVGHYAEFLVGGQCYEIDDLVSDMEEEVGPYVEAVTARAKVRGTYYQTIASVYNAVFTWRTDIYDQLNLEQPETRDELLSHSEAIDEDGDIEARGYPVAAGPVSGKAGAEYINHLINQDEWVVEWDDPDNRDPSNPENINTAWYEDPAIETVEYLDQLSEFGPDPSAISWGSTNEQYANGQFAHSYHLNSWQCQGAPDAGNPEIIENSANGLIPIKEGTDPSQRGINAGDGSPVFKANNREGAEEFLMWWLGDTDRLSNVHQPDPMRWVPPSESIAESDTYTGFDFFEEHPNGLELNQNIINNLMQHMTSDVSYHPYPVEIDVMRDADIFGRFINRVIVGDESPTAVYDELYDEYLEQWDEAREQFGELTE